MLIGIPEAARELLTQDKILLISHISPDGDTLGCAFALYAALKSLGKQVKIRCSDDLPVRFSYLYLEYADEDFKEEYVVAVDVASTQLIGGKLINYYENIDLCIDHHPSNSMYAKKTCLNSDVAAACEIVYEILKVMCIEFTKQIANCLYTGITTDSGCFKYSNTTAKTHQIAADLMNCGADFAEINRFLFDTKSRSRIAVEQYVLNTIEYFYHDKVALVYISQKMIEESHADESELDGVSSLPRMIEGVEVGITIREKPDGSHKISLRTTESVDASKVCALFGGGGHKRAAGCIIQESFEESKLKIVEAVGRFLV